MFLCISHSYLQCYLPAYSINVPVTGACVDIVVVVIGGAVGGVTLACDGVLTGGVQTESNI